MYCSVSVCIVSVCVYTHMCSVSLCSTCVYVCVHVISLISVIPTVVVRASSDFQEHN